MLDEVEVINDWYSDATGNNLAAVFDHFPSYIKDNDAKATYPPESYRNDDNRQDHYYKKISEELTKTRRDRSGGYSNGVFTEAEKKINKDYDRELIVWSKAELAHKAVMNIKPVDQVKLDQSIMEYENARSNFREFANAKSRLDKEVADINRNEKAQREADEKAQREANEKAQKEADEKAQKAQKKADEKAQKKADNNTQHIKYKSISLPVNTLHDASDSDESMDDINLPTATNPSNHTSTSEYKSSDYDIDVNALVADATTEHNKNNNNRQMKVDAVPGDVVKASAPPTSRSTTGIANSSDNIFDDMDSDGDSSDDDDGLPIRSNPRSDDRPSRAAPRAGISSSSTLRTEYTDLLPGNPYLVTTPTRGEKARAKVKKTMNGLSILKNLLSVFVHIGSKFNGTEIHKSVFMSPTQMYNNLVDYLQASAFAQGFGIGDNKDGIMINAEGDFNESFYDSKKMAVEIDLLEETEPTGTPTPWTSSRYGTANIIHVGVTGDSSINIIRDQNTPLFTNLLTAVNRSTSSSYAAPASHSAQTKILLFKKRFGVWMRSVIPGLKLMEGFSFQREDEYFVLVLKSIAAKVLTVTGLYDVFDRPMEFNGLSPIRMILGGSSEMPKVNEEAVPLYLRLPLLIQFYRGIFGFEGAEDPNNAFADQGSDAFRRESQTLKISMVPDIDGTFSGLIRLIFRKTKFISTDAYSDDDLKELIREVNLIHQRMQSKYPHDTVMETIHELIAEVNRRYGIITKEERNNYESEMSRRFDYALRDNLSSDRYSESPETDIAILPEEGDEEIVRPSGAQKLLGATFADIPDKKRSYTISNKHKELVYKFRCAIDKYFENPSEEFSFTQAIKAAQMKLKHETDDEKRFKIVATLVRGIDSYSKIDGFKYVLFHETVIAGLNMLSAVHSLLLKFKTHIQSIDIKALEQAVWNYFETANGLVTCDTLVTGVKAHLVELGFGDTDDLKTQLESVFGKHEALQENGGHLKSGEYALKGGNGIVIATGGSSVTINRFGSTFGVKKQDNGNTFFMDHSATNPLDNPQGGLSSLLAGKTVAQLKAAFNSSAKSEDKLVAETFMRFLFGREYIMKDLLESIYGFSNDFQGNVEVKIDSGKILLNCGGLKTLITEMFGNIGYFIDILRPHIKEDVFKKYVDKTTCGSYYWLYEQIMEKIILGRSAALAPLTGDKTARKGYTSLDELSTKINDTWKCLTRGYSTDGKKVNATTQSSISRINAGSDSRNNFDKVFAEMAFYDASKPGSGLIHSKKTSEGASASIINESLGGLKLADFLHNPYDALHFHGSVKTRVLDTRYVARFYQLYSWDSEEFTLNRSALFAFNQLIAKYIQTFYDPVSGKIYNGLINQFANGTFNRAISDQTSTYPDTAPSWFVKSSGVESVIMRNADIMVASIETTNATLVDPLTKIIRQYLDIGIKSLASTLVERNTLFDTTAKNMVNYNIHIYLMLHALGTSIRVYLDSSDTSASAFAVYNAAPGGIGITTLSAAKTLYATTGTQNYNIDTIMYKLYNYNSNDRKEIYKRCKNITSNHINKLFTLLNVFVRDGNTLQDRRPVAAIALDLHPFNKTPIGKDNISTDYNARLLAVLICRINPIWEKEGMESLYDTYKTAMNGTPLNQDNVDNDYTEYMDAYKRAFTATNIVAKELQGMKSTYAPGSSLPTYLVKYEDTLNSKVTNIEAPAMSSVGDAGHFLLGRDAPIGGVVGSNKMGDFGESVSTNTSKIADVLNFGRRQDPDENHILYSSLSNIMKNIVSSRSILNQSLVYVQENVADIALYVKENMRANLPNYRNLFKALSARCEFIKKFMNQRDISLERKYDMVGYDNAGGVYTHGQAPMHNPWPHKLKPVTDTSDKTKSRFTAILDGIIRGCNSLAASCETTLREIGDDPKYFEIYQNSIKDYRSQYGVDPLMPLSSTLAILKNINHETYMDFFPVHMLGQKQFKLMYGMRSIVGQPNAQPLMEHNIGFTSIVEGYNLVIDGKMQADKDRTSTYYKLFIKLLRYVFEARHIKGFITPHIRTDQSPNLHPNKSISLPHIYNSGLYTRNNLVIEINTAPELAAAILDNKSEISLVVLAPALLSKAPKINKPVYAVAKQLEDVINMTESSFRDDKVKELVDYVCGEAKSDKRLEIQNIIDLGIVPINVHALMREIPLVNLYNYAYTFDRLIIELYYGLQNENARKMISDLCNLSCPPDITSAKDMLVALLIKPYMPLAGSNYQASATGHNGLYEQHVKDMLVGVANSGELGRPKFLSDQIYNKAVFGEVYMTPDDYNEMGPSAGRVVRKQLDKQYLVNIYTRALSQALILADIDGILKKQIFNQAIHKINSAPEKRKQIELLRSLHKFCNALVRYILDNPHVRLDNLSTLIKDKFLHGPYLIPEFKALCGGNGSTPETSAIQLAVISGLLLKILYHPIVYIFNSINDKKHKGITKICNIATSILSCGINLFNNIRYGSSLGIGSGASRETMINRLHGGNAHCTLKYIGELYDEIVISSVSVPFLITSGRTNITADNIITQIKRPLRVILFNTGSVVELSTPTTDPASANRRLNSTKLHWLDVNPDIANSNDDIGERNRFQPSPYGDNNNVLDSGQVKSVDLPRDLKLIFTQLGRLRFDTILIRNLVFIVNLYRSVRMKLQRDLNYDRAITLKSIPITRTQLTEFYGNQVDHGRATKYNQTHPDMYARFNY